MSLDAHNELFGSDVTMRSKSNWNEFSQEEANSKISDKYNEVLHENRNAIKTAYDWQTEQKHPLYDDGTMTFFWRAHTLTVLFLFICVLVYVALFEEEIVDAEYNAKRGLIACVVVFILLGVTVTPDGPFRRPHPALWRLTFCCSIVYELALIFLLFQNKNEARRLLCHIDAKLGKPLDEKSYGGTCVIYDRSKPEDPFHNVKDKLDLFVPTHFVGWWLKTLILRDWWLCMVLSIMFELLEYTLEHQLPNFSECWWDHWILDALVCNGLGIYLGILTLKYFQMKTYYWRGLWNIPTYRGKLKRIIAQFSPYSWMDFEWKPTSSLGRWMSLLFIIFVFSLAELNTFYLKFVLWIPPEHGLNLVRLLIYVFWGALAIRETFQYLDDPSCRKFGRQSWLILAIVATEFLIVAKIDWQTITKPLPRHITYFWLVGLSLLVGWTVWNFYFCKKRNAESAGEDELVRRRERWSLQTRSLESLSSAQLINGSTFEHTRHSFNDLSPGSASDHDHED